MVDVLVWVVEGAVVSSGLLLVTQKLETLVCFLSSC